MIATDEDALICDLAETYHIYNYRDFRPSYIAILAVGLGADSRIKKAISGETLDTSELMMATIIDQLNLIIWSKTKDAEKGRTRPKSILQRIKKSEVSAYQSPQAWEEARQRIIGGE